MLFAYTFVFLPLMKKAHFAVNMRLLAPPLIWLLFLGLQFFFTFNGMPQAMHAHFQYMILLSNGLLLLMFYLHTYAIYPLRLLRGGLYSYALVLVLSLSLFALLNNWLMHPPNDWHPNNAPSPNHQPERFDKPHPNQLFNFLPYVFAVVLSLVYCLYNERQKQQHVFEELKTVQLQTELDFLRSQISPHFLFNVLNTLVSMARKKSDHVEQSLISLSQLLRYMLYDAEGELNSLVTEAEYLRTYINLQLLRFGSDVHVNFYISGNMEAYSIEPMILIPFVENAFKHGIGSTKEPIIDVSLAVDNQNHRMSFNVVNSLTSPEKAAPPKAGQGIGLNNIRRRLSLLYPDKHKLITVAESGLFIVNLDINLK